MGKSGMQYLTFSYIFAIQNRSNFCIYVIVVLYNAHVRIICENMPQTIFPGVNFHITRNCCKSVWWETWLYYGFEDCVKVWSSAELVFNPGPTVSQLSDLREVPLSVWSPSNFLFGKHGGNNSPLSQLLITSNN